MSRTIKESDWKLLKEIAPVALERFCGRILTDINHIASDSTQSCHQRYLAVFALLRNRDREIAEAFNDLRRSTALLQLATIYSHGLLSNNEFARFSAETRELIQTFGHRP